MKKIILTHLLFFSMSVFGADSYFKNSYVTLPVSQSSVDVCVVVDPDDADYPVNVNLLAVDKESRGITYDFQISLAQGDVEGCEILDLSDVANAPTTLISVTSIEGVEFQEGAVMEVFHSNLNLSPFLSLSAIQNTVTSKVFYKDQGDITITVNVNDLENDSVILDWSGSDSTLIDSDGDAANTEMIIDPVSLDSGVYVVKVGAVQSGSLALPTIAEFSFRLEESGIVEQDSDLNGISDVDEMGAQRYQIIESDGDVLLFSQPGTNAQLGEISFQNNLRTVEVSYQVFESWVGSEVPTTSLSVDKVLNFVISDIAVRGAQVLTAIKLEDAFTENKVYFKYKNSSWFNFNKVNGDNYYSAESVAGECPDLSEALYSIGFIEGNDCILLKITDGGQNDSDGVANGVIKDPGGIGQVSSVTPGGGSDSGGSSVSKMEAGSVNTSFLFFLISLLGFQISWRKS